MQPAGHRRCWFEQAALFFGETEMWCQLTMHPAITCSARCSGSTRHVKPEKSMKEAVRCSHMALLVHIRDRPAETTSRAGKALARAGQLTS